MENNDHQKFQLKALEFLQEMELVNSPQLINQLKMNVLVFTRNVREVEFLIYRENRQILVYLDLSLFGKLLAYLEIFLLGRIAVRLFALVKLGSSRRDRYGDAKEVVKGILPTFSSRVIDFVEKEVLIQALKLVDRAVKGGSNEKRNVPSKHVDPINDVRTRSDDPTGSSVPDSKE